MTIEQIASACHEANRAYCRSIGDYTQQEWEVAPAWQRSSAGDGVRAVKAGDVRSPADSHANWLREKQRDGWVYGKVKNADFKTHPCMVPYEELPAEQRAKDAIFFAIASALLATS